MCDGGRRSLACREAVVAEAAAMTAAAVAARSLAGS